MSNPAGSPPAPGLDEENSVINELNNLALKDDPVSKPKIDQPGSPQGACDWEDDWEAAVPPPAAQPSPPTTSGAPDPALLAQDERGRGAGPPPLDPRSTAAGPSAAAGTPPFSSAHCLELTGLSPAIRQRDVEEWAERLKPAVPPYVRWVDETAAVLVFFDPPAARAAQRAAAASSGPTLGTLRGWEEASAGARALPPAELAPPRPRPAASAAVARRLIGAALSMNLRDKGKEEALRDAGRAKREARVAEQARRAALDAAWE
ncbi:hypothetical protein ACKKBG_A23740 [Auxenochlorella protothecoides x Auxenochlorella symbiontica]